VADSQTGKAVIAARVGQLFLGNTSVHAFDIHARPHDCGSGWVGHRTFEDCAINLCKRFWNYDSRQGQKQKDSLSEEVSWTKRTR
jgi:hypothetical protein